MLLIRKPALKKILFKKNIYRNKNTLLTYATTDIFWEYEWILLFGPLITNLLFTASIREISGKYHATWYEMIAPMNITVTLLKNVCCRYQLYRLSYNILCTKFIVSEINMPTLIYIATIFMTNWYVLLTKPSTLRCCSKLS